MLVFNREQVMQAVEQVTEAGSAGSGLLSGKEARADRWRH